MQEWKNKTHQHLSLPDVVTVDGFQVLLSSINGLPSYPIRRKYFSYSSPTQYRCLIHSANDLQDPCPTPCILPMKVDQGPLFNIHSPLSWPTVLTTSPILIIFMSLSFCLMSGNFFPTGDKTTRKVTILLDLLKSVKQLEFQLMYELLPYCSISLWFKNRHSSSRIFNITNSNNLSKNVALWPHIRTLGSEYT